MIYLKDLGIQLTKTEDFLKYLYRTEEGEDALLSQSEYNCIKRCPEIFDSASKNCYFCKNNSNTKRKRIYIKEGKL